MKSDAPGSSNRARGVFHFQVSSIGQADRRAFESIAQNFARLTEPGRQTDKSVDVADNIASAVFVSDQLLLATDMSGECDKEPRCSVPACFSFRQPVH